MPGNNSPLPTLCEHTWVHLDLSQSSPGGAGYARPPSARLPDTHSPTPYSGGSPVHRPCRDLRPSAPADQTPLP